MFQIPVEEETWTENVTALCAKKMHFLSAKRIYQAIIYFSYDQIKEVYRKGGTNIS